jgi:hypothetical protein
MKKNLLLLIFLSLSFYSSFSQVPQGFNYQAIARDASGNAISGATLQVRFGILSDTLIPVIVWQETHSVVKTNTFGLFSVILGTGVKSGGSAATFSAINWRTSPLFIKTEIYYSGSWKNMGSAKLWSVPYSMMAGDVGALPKLAVSGTTLNNDEALFEVRNQTGQTVFAVYNEGVRVYVDNGAKGNRGGFAIGGFGTAKGGVSQNLMTISSDSVRIYVNETAAKGSRGGFAIGGFNTAKGTNDEFMFLTPQNYFIGHKSGNYISTGLYNSTLGYESGHGLTTGSSNIFVGYQSGYTNNAGGSNVFIGNSAGFSNTSGSYNIILGRSAGYSNTTGWGNIMLGDYSGTANTTGFQNVVIGDLAGSLNSAGNQNVFIGASSGLSNTSGSYNAFVGEEVGKNNTTGNYNTFFGYQAGYNSGASSYSTSIGYKAGYSLYDWQAGTFVGFEAGLKSTGRQNTFVGADAGQAVTTGADNVMIGAGTGSSNDYPAVVEATGSRNTFVGYYAGYKPLGATDNVIVGAQDAFGDTHINGSYNVYLGVDAGNLSNTGSRNVFIGYQAGKSETGNDKLIIENGYTGADNYNNALIYGDFASNDVKINGNLISNDVIPNNDTPGVMGQHNVTAYYGIGVKGIGGYIGVRGESTITGSSERYGVMGYASGGVTNYGVYGSVSGAGYAGYFSGNVAVTGTVSQTSDKNLKKNIQQLSGSLEKVLLLQGVNYEWKTESELSSFHKGNGKEEKQSFNFPAGKQIGVIAQDVEKVVPELVQTDADGLKSVDYIKMIPLLIEAIKEQQKTIEAQNARIEALEKALKK